MKRFIIITLVLAIVSGTAFARGAGQAAEDVANYPTRPVQIIIPWGAGGGTDVLARMIMRDLDLGGQSTVAINIPGASGFIGTMDLANRPADGYNIMLHDIPNLLAYTLSGQTSRRLFEELIPICVIAGDYHIVSTNSQSGIRNVQELVAFVRANPGQIRWGTTGIMTPNAVNSMWITEDLGIDGLVTLVPYDSGADARVALLGNHVQVLTGAIGDVRPFIDSGEVIPLMVISDQRIGALPNTPTTLESGAGATHFIARTFFAPRGTPPQVISFLENAFRRVAEDPAFQADVQQTLGADVRFIGAAETQRFIREWYTELEPRFARIR